MHKNEKFLILGIVVCLLAGLIGYSFAYFTSGTIVKGKGAKVDAKTAELVKVSYDAGTSDLKLVNAAPGATASKGFDIKITPSSSEKNATYAIHLNVSNNTFVKCSDSNYNASTNACVKAAEELVYTLKDGAGQVVATGDLLGKTENMVLYSTTKTVEAETTFHYTLEITFKRLETDQNHNMNKTFTGAVKVGFAG